MTLDLSTELGAINIMLNTIGELPINSLAETAGFGEADIAKRILYETNREVQSLKLSFNTKLNYDLVPNVNNEILLPANTLRVKASNVGDSFVERNKKLYNRNDNTFIFEKNATVDISELLNFEEIPEYARNYIIIKAARKFQQRVLGSGTYNEFTLRDEEIARNAMLDAESDIDKFNIIDNDINLSSLGNR